jgi:hypothetical protein
MAEQRAPGLQTLFAIFLGLMVTAFVGVGVYTFYPNPALEFRDRIMNLDRRQQAMGTLKPDVALTPEDRARIQELVDQRNKLQDQSQAASEGWGSRTSIILVSLATLVMVISLTFAKNLPVISNGLLMGGVFTMLYGVGWVIASGTSTTRFIVMSFALLITLALGYLRFVRRRALAEAQGEGASVPGAGFSDLEQRVRTLEERLEQAATALTR